MVGIIEHEALGIKIRKSNCVIFSSEDWSAEAALSGDIFGFGVFF